MFRISAVCLGLIVPVMGVAAPIELAHQGRLIDSAGVPINGTETFTVCLYDDEAAASCTWDGTFTNVAVDSGFYSVTLGTDPGDLLDLSAFTTGQIWLGVTVLGSSELGRQKLLSVPFAGDADTLDGAHFPAVATLDSTTDIKAYVDRRLCETRNGQWTDNVGCEEPIKLGPSTAPASIDWSYTGGTCGANWHVCTGPEYYEYIAIIRRMGCPAGHGFNGGWPDTEPEDRNQMFHGHGNSGLVGFASGPMKPASGQLIQTQASNGTACQLSPNSGNAAQPVWCCANRASSL